MGESGSLIKASRYVLAAAVTFGALGNLLDWQRAGWHSPISLLAQIAEALACVILLWRPRAGLALALVPMGLTLGFGAMEADLLIPILVPAAFIAVARRAESVAVVMIVLAYAALRSAQADSWSLIVAYVALILLGTLSGLGLRVLMVARQRGQGRVQVMEDDASRIRTEERARLASELRSLVTVRLADSSAVLASARRETAPEAMRAAVARVNESCLGALVEVRALVGMLREDPTADGNDESLTGPAAAATVMTLRRRLEDRGVRASITLPGEVDAMSRVTQTTVTKVMEEIVDSVLLDDAAGAEVGVRVDRRRGWVSLDADYPAASVAHTPHDHRMDRLRQRAEALGGGLSMVRAGATRHVRLDLPPAFDPTLDRSQSKRTGWRRWLTWGTLRGALTMAMTLGALSVGSEMPLELGEGRVPWEVVWETSGFVAAGLLLWWPMVGTPAATAAVIGMLHTAHSDDLALAAVLVVASWQAARVNQRWVAVALGSTSSLALLVAIAADMGAAHERALVATVVLTALPALIAARHFIVTRRRHLEEMDGLRRTAEGIRTEERNLLARELHDVVAHHLSVAALQSMAYGDSDDVGELRTALDRMERSTKGAEEEMDLLSRIMAGAGDDDSGGALVRPSTVVGVLAETLRDNGFRVSVTVDPSSDQLPAPTLRTLTRVMQEGVTNILRYGRRDGTCALSLEVLGPRVTLRIANAMPVRRRSSVLSLGYGLAGIRERVDLLGGQFSATAEGDTWVLSVVLPTGAD